MADKYIPQEIEPKWQKRWEDDGLYATREDPTRPKYYFLTMLAYPSADYLHVGHWYVMAPSDARARYMRMKGYNVFYPVGFDAFGLPAENAAIRRSIHPFKWAWDSIEVMRKQLRAMGAMWAWDREAVTCLPGYYKWTQWFFLKFYEAGLAYKKMAPVDFCPKCNTTLAREQVWGEDRHCERCGTPVIKKELEQWFFRITDYAEELLDHSKIDWPERICTMQKNWIGKSVGANVTFVSEQEDHIVVFTTRPDTLWGATFMVLAPEHPLVDKLTTPQFREEVEEYKYQAARQSEIERLSTEKEKTGVFIGAYAINPVNDKHIPIWIADYVMMTYGTGAIMAVPAHDERDFEFALKFGLPIIPVIDRPDGVAKSFAMRGTMKEGFATALTEAGIPFEEQDGSLYVTLDRVQMDRYVTLAQAHLKPGSWTEVVGTHWAFIFNDEVIPFNGVEAEQRILARCKELEPAVRDKRTVMEMLWDLEFYRDILFHVEYGTMINSGPFTDTPGDIAVRKVTEWLEKQGIGQFAINYRLRDWLISRQRYWGAPIPIIYCDKCGIVPVPYEDLPVLLPEDAEFLPTGESPLKFHEGFLHTTCPKCGGPATRETDTMDTFMCSSWYQYAYVTPYHKEGQPLHRDDCPWDPEAGRYWLPVDMYTGGPEHAVMHLLYTRFFTKALRDIGLVDFDEPMLALRNQGVILGPDGARMSKSRGNVVLPDDLVQRYGADTVRGYLMFGWRWEQGGPWDPHGIEGVARWLKRVWGLVLEPPPSSPKMEGKEKGITDLRRWMHKTIKRVSDDLEEFAFNTAIAGMMEFTNALQKAKGTAVYGTEAWEEAIETLLLLLAPCCPHIAEELWARTGRPYSIHQQPWPQFDANMAADEVITLVVQVNGKVRARLEVPADITEEAAREAALSDENIQRHVAGKEIRKVIYVPRRLVNIVV
ncbi:MAG TPA: leucine--tRNA ligase [Chloroflexi bacterium]|nr:leucine--tRNA ligase [Chloroflexota bacterium]